MKKLFTILIAGLITLPAIAQHAAKNRQIHKNNIRHFNSLAPAFVRANTAETALRSFPQINAQQALQQKNALVIMQQLDNFEYQEYDVAGSEWVNSSLNEFTYNTNGNNTSDTYLYWNPDIELYEKEARQELSYNNGTLTEQVYFEWNPGVPTWEPAMKWTYSYDGAGNMTLAYNYYYEEPDWLLVGKDVRTYDGNGNLITSTSSWWDESGSEWINNGMEEHTYNSSGSISVSIYSTWDFFNEEWVNEYKDEYAYNGSDQLIMGVYYSWNVGNEQWINDYKEDFNYDSNMNLVIVLEQEWNGAQWVNSYKTEITYNNDYTIDELILPWIFYDESEQLLMHMPLVFTESEYLGGTYVLSYRSLYNFSEVNITGVPAIEISKMGIYPQPANGDVTFNWETNNSTFNLAVYDMNGRLLLSKQIENNVPVLMDHLTSGIYFYRLSGNNLPEHSGKISIK